MHVYTYMPVGVCVLMCPVYTWVYVCVSGYMYMCMLVYM